MRPVSLAIFSTLIFIMVNSCNSTEPEKPIKYKDPRDMVWTMDTLVYPGSSQVLLNSIWASSPTDVYAVGHNESNSGQYWHYDGEKWESINLFQYLEQSSWNLSKIYGFSNNDFWVVGARDRDFIREEYKEGLVLQYKNGWWIDHKLKYKTWISSCYGVNSDDMWFCGAEGIVLNYYQSKWRVDTIKSPSSNTFSTVYGIIKRKDELLLMGIERNNEKNRLAFYFMRGQMNNWKFEDSVIFKADDWGGHYPFGSKGMFKLNDQNIFSYGGTGIWFLDNSTFKWRQELRNNYVINYMYGVSERYMFAIAAFGLIYFREGTSWTQLTNIVDNQEQIHFYSIWTDGQEIFLLGIKNNKTYILHGK